MSNNEEIKEIPGIDDLKNISEDDAKRLIAFLENKKLTEQQLSALIQASPEVAKEIAKAAAEVAKSMQRSQSDASDALKAFYSNYEKAFGVLAEKSQSEEERKKLVEALIEFSKQTTDQNKSNNGVWQTALLCATGIIVVGIIGFVAIKVSENK